MKIKINKVKGQYFCENEDVYYCGHIWKWWDKDIKEVEWEDEGRDITVPKNYSRRKIKKEIKKHYK